MDKHTNLQCLQAYEAGYGESIDDILLARHRFSLPPTRRPVSGPGEAGSAFSSAGPEQRVSSAEFLVRGRGWRRGPGLFEIRSPPPPLSVTLRAGATALPEASASTGTVHVNVRTKALIKNTPWSGLGVFTTVTK